MSQSCWQRGKGVEAVERNTTLTVRNALATRTCTAQITGQPMGDAEDGPANALGRALRAQLLKLQGVVEVMKIEDPPEYKIAPEKGERR